MELTPGSKMSATHSLLMVVEILSIDSTSQSAVTATAYVGCLNLVKCIKANQRTAVTVSRRIIVNAQLSWGCFFFGSKESTACSRGVSPPSSSPNKVLDSVLTPLLTVFSRDMGTDPGRGSFGRRRSRTVGSSAEK